MSLISQTYLEVANEKARKCRIEKETEAFARILKLAEMGKVIIVSSDILNLWRIKRYGRSKE